MSSSENLEVLLFQDFSPKPGFTLSQILCTSYGFDPDVFLTLLFYAIGEASEDFSSGSLSHTSKEKLRTVLSEALPKCTIIVAKEAPKLSESLSPIQLTVLDQVNTVKSADNTIGTFHPKLVLALYENDKGDAYGRLYVGSKNLTSAAAQEFGGIFELNKGPTNPDTLNLLDSIEKEPGINKKSQITLKRIRDFIISKKISLPNDINVKIQSRLIRASSLNHHFKDWFTGLTSLHIHSPWVSKGALNIVNNTVKNTKVYIKCLPLERNILALNQFPGVSKLFDSKLTENGFFHRANSHAKILGGFKNSRLTFLAFGSMNLSDRGVGTAKQNTEILATYHPKNNAYNFLKIKPGLPVENGQDFELTDADQKKIDLLNLLFIKSVNYDKSTKELVYEIESPPPFTLIVRHYLIEEIEGTRYITFKITKKSAETVHVSFLHPISHLSNYCTFTTKGALGDLNVDQSVDLDKSFYEARSNIKVFDYFKLSTSDIADALYEILGYPTPSTNVPSEKNGELKKSNLDLLERVINEFPLDKLALKLYNLKQNDLNKFNQAMARIDAILGDIKLTRLKVFELFEPELKVILDEVRK